MNAKQLQTAMRSGQRVYGTLIVSNSPRWPSTVAKIGLDFVFIDTEHISLDRDTLSWMCQIYNALDLAPIVRIPSPDPYAACMALDGGAAGIVAPYVETVEQVKALYGATKLRPIKGRKLDDVLHNGEKFGPTLTAYQKTHHENNLLIINIESQPALDNLDGLLSAGGVDGVLIGPHDLSSSLGMPEEYDRPEFNDAVKKIFQIARAHGVGAGIHCLWDDVNKEIEWASKDGLNFIIHSADILAMRSALTRDIASIRSAVGDQFRHEDKRADNI